MRRGRRARLVRGTAAAVVTLLVGAAAAACTPVYIVSVANRTDLPLALWLGNAKIGYTEPGAPWRRDGFDLGGPDPIEVPVRAVSVDGSMVAVLDDLPIAEGDVLVIRDADLQPATATATVVNNTDARRSVRLASWDWTDLAHGERAVVPLGAPAGGCVVYPEGQSLDPSGGLTPVPASWGGTLCDGDVVRLADPVPNPIYVDNVSTYAVRVWDGSTTIDTIDPGVVGRIPAPAGGCTTQVLTVVAWYLGQVVLPGVCAGDTITVDLPPTATIDLENRTTRAVFAKARGADFLGQQVALGAGERATVHLSMPATSCATVFIDMYSWEELTIEPWSGEVCDADLLVLDPPGTSQSSDEARLRLAPR